MSRERPGHTLQITALVNEAYLRLIEINQVSWQNRTHFFAMSARAMRRILVDSARARYNDKRGGNIAKVSLDDALRVAWHTDPDLVALDEALKELEARHPRKGQVVELRYFGGLSVEETAEALHEDDDGMRIRRHHRLAGLRRQYPDEQCGGNRNNGPGRVQPPSLTSRGCLVDRSR